MLLPIYRGAPVALTLNIDDKAKLSRKLKSDDKITIPYQSPTTIDVRIGDYIVFGGNNYYCNTLPNVTKNSSNNFEYNFEFEAVSYDLGKVMYMLLGEGDFDLMNNLSGFIDLLITNLNRVGSGWTKGTVDSTDYKNIHFAAENCLSVLNKLSTEFDIEFYFVGKQINVTKFGVNNGITLQYGYNNGLYKITRNTVDSANVTTRLYAFGSDKNIPNTYRSYSKRLKSRVWKRTISTPGSSPTDMNPVVGDLLWLTITSLGITIPQQFNGSGWVDKSDTVLQEIIINNYAADGSLYLSKNSSIYGVIEEVKIFDDIYPTRTGTISAVDATNVLKFTDSAMNFDLKAQLLAGVKAKLHFQTGNLGGYEFEIADYVHSTKTYTLVLFNDGKGGQLPSAIVKPTVGDTYKLVDINMPNSYIADAEFRLIKKAKEYLEKVSSPKVSYKVDCDPLMFSRNNITLNLGDYVTITDSDIGVNRLIRIMGYNQSLLNPFDYDIDLADEVFVPLAQKLIVSNSKLKGAVESAGITAPTKASSLKSAPSTKAAVDNGISTQGALELGEVGNERVGLDGSGNSATEVRFYAGASKANKNSAPFKILDNGTLIISTVNGQIIIDADTLRLAYGVKNYVVLDRDPSLDFGFIKILDANQTKYMMLRPDGIVGKDSSGNYFQGYTGVQTFKDGSNVTKTMTFRGGFLASIT